LADRNAWQATRESLLSSLGAAPIVAATAVAARLGTIDAADLAADPLLSPDSGDPLAGSDPFESPPGEQPRGGLSTPSRGRGGTAFGKAVHAALQTVALDEPAGSTDLADIARAQAAAEGIVHRAGEVERRVRAALGSPTVRAAAAAPHWRELYVGVPVGGVLVEGFVDLLFRRADGLVVVDYKTDTVPDDAAVEAAVERYRLQGATYALALQEYLGETVADMVFVFLTPSGAVERTVDDLPAAVDEVRNGLAALV
jgi:hypothetical protein